jgi:hypothetical protein
MPIDNRPSAPDISRQQLRDAGRAVANYCLLPDPRPHFRDTRSFWDKLVDFFTTSVNEYNEEQCAARQIRGKLHTGQRLERDDPRYQEVLRDAARRAEIGASRCEWREFNDTQDEPYSYRGQIVGGQCRAVRTPLR